MGKGLRKAKQAAIRRAKRSNESWTIVDTGCDSTNKSRFQVKRLTNLNLKDKDKVIDTIHPIKES